MDNALFRKNFPEFADLARYPDPQLTFWATLAEAQVKENRWKAMYSTGVMLYVAHEVTLAGQNLRAGEAGGTPGGASGPVNSKTVGSVTVAFDTQQSAEKDAGHWNLTAYGKQFIRLARTFGAGPVTL